MLQHKDDNPHFDADAKKRTLGDVEKLKKEIRDSSPDDHLRRILVSHFDRTYLYIATA